MTCRTLGIVVMCLVVLLCSCRSYEPIPLDPKTVVDEVDRERSVGGLSPTSEAVTFDQAAAWMRQYSPSVKDVIAAYRTALALADVPTPLPNMSLSVGPQYGFGQDVTSNAVAPFGSLGLTIPLNGRLGLNDDLNHYQAEVARIDGLSTYRGLYLELRRLWSRLTTMKTILVTRQRLVMAAKNSVSTSRRLVEAGRATALDVAIFDLELGKSQLEALKSTADMAHAQAALAALVGVKSERFNHIDAASIPELIHDLPTLPILQEKLVWNHGGLARLRARYDRAEASLRLEIAKQYPDLKIGTSAGGQTGESQTMLGLTLGIQLPIFDRNQQAIAQAEGRRSQVRAQFEAEASRSLAELERAYHATVNATVLHQTLVTGILPQAANSVELARATLEAGSGDVARLLDAERSYRELLIESQQASMKRMDAWVDLEKAIGLPLTRIELEQIGGPPSLPEGLRAQQINPESEEEGNK